MHNQPYEVYLGLGTNIGRKVKNIGVAVSKIGERIGKSISLSALYTTAPWGFSSPNSFLNAVCRVETFLSPLEVLEETQAIEREMGRRQKSVNGQYADRIIDIDLLLYGDLQINTPQLVIPHPLMTERRFVMEPLVEIAPDVIHPLLGIRLKDIPLPE